MCLLFYNAAHRLRAVALQYKLRTVKDYDITYKVQVDLRGAFIMSNHGSKSVEVNLPESKDAVIALIVALTGENPQELHNKTLGDLLSHLGKLTSALKIADEKLIEQHDQSKEYSDMEAFKMWRLADRGIIQSKKSKINKTPESARERVKFLVAALTDKIRFRTENNLGLSGMSMSADLTPTGGVTQQNLPIITNKQPFLGTKSVQTLLGSSQHVNQNLHQMNVVGTSRS
jgi:hypothetical protein